MKILQKIKSFKFKRKRKACIAERIEDFMVWTKDNRMYVRYSNNIYFGIDRKSSIQKSNYTDEFIEKMYDAFQNQSFTYSFIWAKQQAKLRGYKFIYTIIPYRERKLK